MRTQTHLTYLILGKQLKLILNIVRYINNKHYSYLKFLRYWNFQSFEVANIIYYVMTYSKF